METIAMRRLGSFGLCMIFIFLVAGIIYGQTMYIRTVVRITLRSGPGVDHKIISMINSGQEIEVLDTEGEWSRIKTPQDQIGWVMTSLITSEKPTQFIPISETLTDRRLLEKQGAILEENENLKAELSGSKETIDTLTAAIETLKRESSDCPKLKADYQQTTATITEQTTKINILENKLTELQLQQNIWWFLSGAGVLIIGFIIGYSAKRQRRSPLLR